MTEAMPFLQKAILLSYDPLPFPRMIFFMCVIPSPIVCRSEYSIAKRDGEVKPLFVPPPGFSAALPRPAFVPTVCS